MADVRFACCASALARAFIRIRHDAWVMGEEGGVMRRGLLRASAFFSGNARYRYLYELLVLINQSWVVSQY